MLVKDKHSSLLQTFVNYARKSFMTLGRGDVALKNVGFVADVALK
jgi:hypothetical protein